MDAPRPPTEEAAIQALVRQYLTVRGFDSVLSAFNDEHEPAPEKIGSSKRLAAVLNMEKLVAANKKKGSPFGTLLELLAHHFLKGSIRDASGRIPKGTSEKKERAAARARKKDEAKRKEWAKRAHAAADADGDGLWNLAETNAVFKKARLGPAMSEPDFEQWCMMAGCDAKDGGLTARALRSALEPDELACVFAALFPDEAPDEALAALAARGEDGTAVPPPPDGMEWCRRGDRRNKVLSSGNVAKYRLSSLVQNLGPKGDVSGLVVALRGSAADGLSGPGEVEIAPAVKRGARARSLRDGVSAHPAGMPKARPPAGYRCGRAGDKRNMILNSSEVSKYALGSLVANLGPRGNVGGVVVAVLGSSEDGLSGPGEVEIAPARRIMVAVGTRVRCLYKQTTDRYPGRITAQDPSDGTYTVTYDDGDIERDVARERFDVADAAAAGADEDAAEAEEDAAFAEAAEAEAFDAFDAFDDGEWNA
jgi:hypothetical protein